WLARNPTQVMLGPAGDGTGMPPLHGSHLHASGSIAAGAPLPAFGSVEQPRTEQPLRGVLDVAGGIAFAAFIGILCMRTGSAVFTGVGWIPVIAWESVWLVAAMLCSPLMPSGTRHDISWRST